MIIIVSDLSDERAVVIKQLHQAGIPLVGVPPFPAEEGYYFTVANAPRAAARYEKWKAWSDQRQLRWDRVAAGGHEPVARERWRLTDEAIEASYRAGGRPTLAWRMLCEQRVSRFRRIRCSAGRCDGICRLLSAPTPERMGSPGW